VYASMSGSGATVYGLFAHEPIVENAFPEYFLFSCLL
jgi:4-diphosphocytidyl-2C-methyl-D-erythritol kinase